MRRQQAPLSLRIQTTPECTGPLAKMVGHVFKFGAGVYWEANEDDLINPNRK